MRRRRRRRMMMMMMMIIILLLLLIIITILLLIIIIIIIQAYTSFTHYMPTQPCRLWRTFLIFSRSEYTDELTIRRKFCIASWSCAAVCAVTLRGVIRVITTVCVVFFLVVTHLPCKTLWDYFFYSFVSFVFSQ